MHFTVEAQRIALNYLCEGAIAIDATAGNGFDTLFLAEQVGGSGMVYAIDIQHAAIESIRNKLSKHGYSNRCKLFRDSHANLDVLIPTIHQGNVSVAMFNLGFLPFGDKSVITTSESTIQALHHLHHLLRPGGLLTIIAYPGHPGGKQETESVAKWVSQNEDRYRIHRYQDLANPKSPILWTMESLVAP